MNVIKRDGTPQEYSFIKIVDVVNKAFKSVDQVVPEKFLEQVKESVEKLLIKNNGQGTPIEEIIDCIQNELIKRNKYEVVESFIRYRQLKEERRLEKMELIKQIQDKLFASNVQNQNANLDEASFGGRLGETASVVARDRALKKMSKLGRKNHENNMIYIHDLDHFITGDHNCLSYPFDSKLKSGVKTRQTDIREAGSVNTAMQLVAVNFQLQSLQQFGGVSATHLDWSMIPYVRKSFRKHYISNWIKKQEKFMNLDILSIPYDDMNKMIEELVDEFYDKTGLFNEDFTFDSRMLNDRLKQESLFDTKNEVYQAVEGLFHNLNTLQSRSGNQLPFSSINLGTCTLLEGRMVIKAVLEVCMRGLGKSGVTSIFPCVIFQYKKGVNDKPGTPNYDLKRLALKSTALRIYPNYANCDWTNNQSAVDKDRKDKQEYIDSLSAKDYNKLVEILDERSDIEEQLGIYVEQKTIYVDKEERPIEIFSTMGCRTANLLDINALDNFKRNIQCVLDGHPEDIDDIFSAIQKDGRGNICPTTIILPTLAAMTRKKLEKQDKFDDKELVFKTFISLLSNKIEEAKDMLLERFNHIASQSPKSARYMYENHIMSGYHEEEGIISALKHGTLAIGQLGLSETLHILFGFDHTTEKGMEYAKIIEKLFADKCAEYKQEYKLNFGVYYTPAESLVHTSFKKFKKAYPEYDFENVTYWVREDGTKKYKEYFTNSIHVPVYHNCDPFTKIDIESQLTGYSSAGCITYVEIPDMSFNNVDGLEKIVDYAMEHDVPYFAMNTKICQCHKCGERVWDPEIGCCPKCECPEIDELGRICGYLSTTVKHFNKGKQDEFYDRVKHIKN